MPLNSRLFQNNAALEACLINDSAHVTQDSHGEHVRLIQRALVYLGEKAISGAEYRHGYYGPTTAAAVLRFKQLRRIINFSYQVQADNIVGKMTIKKLDEEIFATQNLPQIYRNT